MRVMERRLRRLEERRAAHDRRIIIEFGYIKQLPADYKGERDVVIVSRVPHPNWGEYFESSAAQRLGCVLGMLSSLEVQVLRPT